jgi:hypothetical protein
LEFPMQKESSASGSLPLSEFSLSVVQARGGAELLQTVRMKELVDTIDIADSTIRAQVEEIAQLRSSLRKAEWELQYNKLGKQDASNLYTISPPPSQVLSARVPQAAGGQGRNLGMPSLSEYQNGAVSSPGDTSSSAQLHMPSNGARNGVVATNGGHNGRAHGTRVMENGNNRLNRQTSSVSPRM